MAQDQGSTTGAPASNSTDASPKVIVPTGNPLVHADLRRPPVPPDPKQDAEPRVILEQKERD